MHTEELTMTTLDSLDVRPDFDLIGTRLLHTGNGKVYQITGFCWLGETDEWGYLHSELREDGIPGVTIARPLHHIEGYRLNGEPRYEEII